MDGCVPPNNPVDCDGVPKTDRFPLLVPESRVIVDPKLGCGVIPKLDPTPKDEPPEANADWVGFDCCPNGEGVAVEPPNAEVDDEANLAKGFEPADEVSVALAVDAAMGADAHGDLFCPRPPNPPNPPDDWVLDPKADAPNAGALVTGAVEAAVEGVPHAEGLLAKEPKADCPKAEPPDAGVAAEVGPQGDTLLPKPVPVPKAEDVFVLPPRAPKPDAPDGDEVDCPKVLPKGEAVVVVEAPNVLVGFVSDEEDCVAGACVPLMGQGTLSCKALL